MPFQLSIRPPREVTLLQLRTPVVHKKYKGHSIFDPKKPNSYAPPPGRGSGGSSIMHLQNFGGILRIVATGQQRLIGMSAFLTSGGYNHHNPKSLSPALGMRL